MKAICVTDPKTASLRDLLSEPTSESRWEIENQGFNDAKSRHGLEHICHHHANSLLIGWLLTMLALTIERLYRLRYLHRGKHRVQSSAQLLLHLWLSLSRPYAADSS